MEGHEAGLITFLDLGLLNVICYNFRNISIIARPRQEGGFSHTRFIAMASVDLKVQILRRSIGSLNRWLEASQQLLSGIPMELEGNSQFDRRELALKYKDLLLQIREKCQSIQEINSLYQELDGCNNKSKLLEEQLAEISISLAQLNKQFTNTCAMAKLQYTKLAEKISAPSSPALSSSAPSSPASSITPLSMQQKPVVAIATQDNHDSGLSTDSLSSRIEAKDTAAHVRSMSASGGLQRPHSASHVPLRVSATSNGFSLLSPSSSPAAGSPIAVTRSVTAPPSPRHHPAPQSQLGISLSFDKLSSPASSPSPVYRKAVSNDRLEDDGGGQWDNLSTQSSQSMHSMRSLQNRVIRGFGDAASFDSLNSESPDVSCSNSQSQDGSNPNLLDGTAAALQGSEVKHQRDLSKDSVWSNVLTSPPCEPPSLPPPIPNTVTSLQFSQSAQLAKPVEAVRPNKLTMPSSLPLAQPTKSPVQSPLQPTQPNQSVPQPNQSVPQPNQSVQQPNQSVQQLNQSVPQPNQSVQQPNQSVQQPNQSVQQPNQSVQQPNQSVQLPNQSVQLPNQSVQLPNQSVQKPVQEAEELKTLLARITNQVQDCIYNMTQHKGCALDRTTLEQHIAEIKSMLSALEDQESVLFQLLATFSPSVRRKLSVDPTKAASSPALGYPPANVVARKDEIVKLSDRVDLLSRHCKQVLVQAEGVLAMVTQHAGQAGAVMEDLSRAVGTVESVKAKGHTEECWEDVRKVKITLDADKQKMASLEQLSAQLLQLEPTFDGTPVRREQDRLTREYQRTTPVVMDLLETLGKARVERLLLETAAVMSWVTMTEASLHQRPGEEEVSLQDVASHHATLASFNSDLQGILAITPLDGFGPLQELKSRVRELTHSLTLIEQRAKEPQKDMASPPKGSSSPPKGNSSPLSVQPPGSISSDQRAADTQDYATPPPTPPGYDRVPVRFPVTGSLHQCDRRGAQTLLYDVPPTRREADGAEPQVTLHGDLIRHISIEWVGLSDEIPSPEDTRNIMDSIGKVRTTDQRSSLLDLLQTLYGMTRSLQELLAQMSAVKIPTLPSLEKIHGCLDDCQMFHTHLATTAGLLETLCSQSLPLALLLPRTQDTLRLSLLLELRLFDLSLLHCRAAQRLQSLEASLHRREEETNAVYRQVHGLTSSLQEGVRLLASMEEVTNAAAYMEKCKTLHSTLCSMGEKRLVLNAQMREWSVSDPYSLICGRLMGELGDVDREWDRVLKGLLEMPVSEPNLFRQMIKNILKEVVVMEANLPQLQARTVDLKRLAEKLATCEKYHEQSKAFSQALKTAKKALRGDGNMPTSPQATAPPDPLPQSPIRRAQTQTTSDLKNGNGSNASSQKGTVRPQTLVEMVITSRGPALTAITPQSPAHIRDQCKGVLVQVQQLMTSLDATRMLLRADKALLEGFYRELSSLEAWLASMGSSEPPSKEAMATKGPGCADQVVAKQAKFEGLQAALAEVMAIPSEEEERKKVERRLLTLYLDWDEVCQKFVPPGALPLLYSPFTATLQAPSRFEDPAQMVEWLILIESKLQPERIVVGDFSQLRGMLRMLQVIEREMKGKQAEYQCFIKGEVESPDDPTSSLPPSKGASLTPNKCVKFSDENTLQRVRRKQEIKSLVIKPRPSEGTGGESGSSPPLSRDPVAAMAMSPPTLSLLPDSPTSSLASNEGYQYQLSLLWKGIWGSVGQWRQRLELIQDIWRAFESRREALVSFVCSAEETLKNLLPSLNCVKDFDGLDAAITQYKRLNEDMSAYDQKLATLKSLATNLVNHHHSTDDTKDFQATMSAINQRWSDLKESLTKLQAVLEPLSVQWTSFYSLFHSFTQWLNNMDFEMASMNPFVSDMVTIQTQLDKQKEIQQQVTFKEGTLEKIQAQASKLLQGAGGSYISSSVMHKKLDGMAKTWSHVQQFAKERTTAFEQALAAKQETLAQLSKCLLWLNQAERHLASQKPLGADFSQVHVQYEEHQAFWKDVLNQKPQIDSLVASGKFVGRESSKGKTTAECVSMDSAQTQFSSLQERWKALLASGEQWGELLEKALPEMEKLQSLRIECAHRLSDAELKVTSFDAVSNKFLVLIKQLDSIKELETQLDALGNLMGVANTSQQRLLELGVPANSSSVDLMTKMAAKFGELKQTASSRRVTIERAMLRFESNVGMAALPNGWHRAKTDKGTPYYIQVSNGNHTQWQHPELSELYKELQSMHTLPFYPSVSYPVALKLRAIQKKTKLDVLPLQHVVHCFKDNPKGPLTATEMATYAQAMFQHAEGEFVDKIALSKAIELTTCWIRDVYDKSHEGSVTMTSFQIATICMSNGKLDNKYRSLFKVISQGEEGATIAEVANFLQEVVQIPLSFSVNAQNGSSQTIDTCAQDCFKKYASGGKLQLVKFLQWVQSEPDPVAWLPILHRLSASDSVQHNVRCTTCQIYPIVGFRYRCMDCTSLDLCQKCYWAGESTKEHDRSSHYMEEYCIAKEEGKDFLLKALRKSLRKKKEGEVTTQEEASSPSRERSSKGSPAIKKRHSTYIETSISETDELEIGSRPPKGITYHTPPPTRRLASNVLSEPLPSSPPLPIRTRAAPQQKNSPTELDRVIPSPPVRGRSKSGPLAKNTVMSPPLPPPPLPQPYMTPLSQAYVQSNGAAQLARPVPVQSPPKITAEAKHQQLNGVHSTDPQGAIPEAPYNPYGVHTHHRTARGTVTTTTTVC